MLKVDLPVKLLFSQGFFIQGICGNFYVMYDLTLFVYWTEENRSDTENLIDNFLTFFIAGQETTANTLAFAFNEMGRNPEVLKKWIFSNLL